MSDQRKSEPHLAAQQRRQVYRAEIVPFAEGLSQIGLAATSLKCQLCGELCHRFMQVAGQEIGRPDETYHIVRCLNCIFWGAYYVFFNGSEPTKVYCRDGETHHFMQEMICDKPVQASIRWEVASSSGLTGWDAFAGGSPAWLQHPEWPSCPQCKAEMDFILQMSSDALDQGHRQLSNSFYIQLEYGATLYYFFCHLCQISASVTQNP